MIEHSQPTLGPEEKRAILAVLETNYIAEGPQVQCFEEDVAQYVGALGGVATSTGTLGLHLALVALDLQNNDEVIIPSYTCRSVLNAVLYAGAKPVLCDVNQDDYNPHLEDVKKVLTPQTKAAIIPHMFGGPAVIDAFEGLDISLIEDCAHAIGASYKGRKVGRWGDLALFSFEGTKYIVTGEGGMVLANKPALLGKLRGLKEPDADDYLTKYTYRMTDLQAAVGRQQLKKLDQFIAQRRFIAQRYDQAFKEFPIKQPVVCAGGEHIYQRYMIQIKGDIQRLMQACLEKGIKVKQPVKPQALHRYLGRPVENYPNTEHIMRCAVSIPIYPSLNEEQIDYIITTLKELLKEYA